MLMTCDPGTATGESFQTAFTTAILLTGSLKWAEAATLEWIESSDLILMAITALHVRRRERPEEVAAAAALLPRELRRVLQVRPDLRHSYVLRLLMAIPREMCAWLLDLDAEEVDQNACLAAQALARIVQEEQEE